MGEIWFTGLLSIVILVVAGLGMGAFTVSEVFGSFLQSETTLWAVLIFGVAILITGATWFMKSLNNN